MQRSYQKVSGNDSSSDHEGGGADTDITQMAPQDRTMRPSSGHAGPMGGKVRPDVNSSPSRSGIPTLMTNSSDAVFTGLLIRCVVQLELVEAVNSIVFGPGTSRKDERHAIRTSSVSSPTDALPASNGPVTPDAHGMQQMEEQVRVFDISIILSLLNVDSLHK